MQRIGPMRPHFKSKSKDYGDISAGNTARALNSMQKLKKIPQS